MARVRSTARVEREGGEAEASETIPISEAMQRSGLLTTEEMPAAEAGPTTAEGKENIDHALRTLWERTNDPERSGKGASHFKILCQPH